MINSGVSPEVPKLPDMEIDESEISSIEADHLAFEQSAEHKDDILHAEKQREEIEEEDDDIQSSGTGTGQQVGYGDKDEVLVEVEHILEDGIGSFYEALPEEAKPIFKTKGEETANEIAEMVRSMHAKVKRIVFLITEWLKTIPGVNTYFLEQEAKIKADRIMAYIEARKEQEDSRV